MFVANWMKHYECTVKQEEKGSSDIYDDDTCITRTRLLRSDKIVLINRAKLYEQSYFPFKWYYFSTSLITSIIKMEPSRIIIAMKTWNVDKIQYWPITNLSRNILLSVNWIIKVLRSAESDFVRPLSNVDFHVIHKFVIQLIRIVT